MIDLIMSKSKFFNIRCIIASGTGYDCFAINSIPQQVADSMHGFAVIEYARVQIHRLKS